MEQLTAYHWPGNVRELKNVVERAVVLTEGRVVGTGRLGVSAGSFDGWRRCGGAE